MNVTHNDPMIAVRTPAYSGLDDCGDAINERFTQLRNSSVEFGICSAASSIAGLSKIDSTRVHVAAIRGFTTSSVSSWTSSASVRSSSAFVSASARARPFEMFAFNIATLSARGASSRVAGALASP